MKPDFEADLEKALAVVQGGGIILYPTDTVWGLGCDATNETAVDALFAVKNRPANKSVIIFLAEARDILQYVADPDPSVFQYIENLKQPTTIVFQNAIGLAQNVPAPDGSVGIRIVQDAFCRHLVKRLRKPLVSTSANTSGMPTPTTFDTVEAVVKSKADYVVAWRQHDLTPAQPSRVVRWNKTGPPTVLRP